MSSQILCPTCRSEAVAVPSFTFDQTRVEVRVCSDCQLKGLVSVEIRKSFLIDLAIPETVLRHTSGLVAFS